MSDIPIYDYERELTELKEQIRCRDKKIEELNQTIKRLELESDSDALLCAYMRGVSDGRDRRKDRLKSNSRNQTKLKDDV